MELSKKMSATAQFLGYLHGWNIMYIKNRKLIL